MRIGLGDELRDMVRDAYRYLDTTVPRGVNRELFTQLKYINKHKLLCFEREHKEDTVNRQLIEAVSLDMFLSLSDDEKIKRLRAYGSVE